MQARKKARGLTPEEAKHVVSFCFSIMEEETEKARKGWTYGKDEPWYLGLGKGKGTIPCERGLHFHINKEDKLVYYNVIRFTGKRGANAHRMSSHAMFLPGSSCGKPRVARRVHNKFKGHGQGCVTLEFAFHKWYREKYKV